MHLLVALDTELATARSAEEFLVGRSMRIMAGQAGYRTIGPRIDDAGSHRVGQRSVSLVTCAANSHGIGSQQGGLVGTMGFVACGTAPTRGLFRVK